MGPDRDRTRDPWICSQTSICSQARYRLRYAARQNRGFDSEQEDIDPTTNIIPHLPTLA